MILWNYLAHIAAILVGLTFLASGFGKIRNLGGFVIGVLDYEVLSPRLAVIYARTVPVIELATSLLLLIGLWPILAGLTSTGLLLSFLVAVTINLARGRRIDCHCFGSGPSEPLGWVTVVRLLILIACSALLSGWHGKTFWAVPLDDLVPLVLSAFGLLIGVYLLSAIPPMLKIWQIKATLGVTVNGGRISLRRMHPLGHASDLPRLF